MESSILKIIIGRHKIIIFEKFAARKKRNVFMHQEKELWDAVYTGCSQKNQKTFKIGKKS